MDIRWKQRFSNFTRALNKFSDAMYLATTRPLSELEQQGLIQGFEFVHELAWNVLKDYLEYEGVHHLTGSRSTAREAFKRGILTDGQVWMDMIESRSLSSHTYNNEIANAIVADIKSRYYPEFVALNSYFSNLN